MHSQPKGLTHLLLVAVKEQQDKDITKGILRAQITPEGTLEEVMWTQMGISLHC
jgi:hypothetical protein